MTRVRVVIEMEYSDPGVALVEVDHYPEAVGVVLIPAAPSSRWRAS
jgi:hypothetical protein